jgi:hypothetical protein
VKMNLSYGEKNHLVERNLGAECVAAAQKPPVHRQSEAWPISRRGSVVEQAACTPRTHSQRCAADVSKEPKTTYHQDSTSRSVDGCGLALSSCSQ